MRPKVQHVMIAKVSAIPVVVTILLAACTGATTGQGGAVSAPPSWMVSYDGPVPTTSSSLQPDAVILPKDVLWSYDTADYGAPAAAYPGFGSIWVPSHRGTTLYRIDPTTGGVQKIDMGQDCFNNVGVGFRHVFVACDQNELVVDPNTNQVVGRSDCGQFLSFSSNAIWSAAGNGIQRCDPTTFQRTHLYPVGAGYSGTAYGFGSVWAANGLQHTVIRLSPDGKVLKTIHADGVSDGDFDCHVLVAFGAVWDQCDPSNKIYRIDPTNNHVKTYTIQAPQLPDFYDRWLAAGLGSLWLATSVSHITRFDPATMKVLGTYPDDKYGGGSGAISIYDGSLWLTNPEQDTIWRDRIAR